MPIRKKTNKEMPRLGDISKKNKSRAITCLLRVISRKQNNKTTEAISSRNRTLKHILNF